MAPEPAPPPPYLSLFPFALTAADRQCDAAPDGRFGVLEPKASAITPKEIRLATNSAIEFARLVSADP